MLFNSLNFAIFLPLVFIFYWFVVNKSLRSQNILLLLASYFFYACWDWRFLFLLIFSTALDYFSGIKIFESTNQNMRKFWFWLSISINLGFLGIFKYYNFFVESFVAGVANFGLQINPLTLDVLLPVGISFYTFHGLSYVIDIYKGRISAEKNIVDYSLFVSFFPLLVAGPIERATHLLPQIKQKRVFDYEKAVDGLRQILWGLFKKIVIADQCAQYVNTIFNDSAEQSGSTLLLGAIFFSFQIYGDFSGYSDIAIGAARLLGIDLLKNFAFPYFSRDIAEFWRRWHISLSTWFRDYLYIPLGGSKGNVWMKIRNTFIIFLVSGFWHGANWTFIVWGFLNALYIMPSIIFNTNRKNLDVVAQGKYLPSIKEVFQIVLTFSLTVFAWIFFRANNLEHAIDYISHMFSSSLFSMPTIAPVVLLVLILLFILIEWQGREEEFALAKLRVRWKSPLRYLFYYIIIVAIFVFSGEKQQFIYFQF
ncbi:D-alanyl-lipoteichoic acid acyltransferase DltB (MBOAT superfamily) [Flavobacterium nitrogenifigens]|uniref:D-alanyl-lipoteichoic acid acyltransferase DltB (MBOAT superfamily) n=2 Tax=Flavobacterium TaxID=237 RepID=A0A7W7IV34_9FLAO|nr:MULTISPECIES: MBOAT family protein [Flavobacterium]MBB4801131.1 D-alanyl-lipoteichoic acid acyltransferase DltB (MBOAT superfamily) [Flavobacterium nitrogenifigens]MBB6385121.1 D-alanyl-lipoteichoic acid acyltransferase DltB (MBOAT superfamily) [Flavobacterium notoginsengisoli]